MQGHLRVSSSLKRAVAIASISAAALAASAPAAGAADFFSTCASGDGDEASLVAAFDAANLSPGPDIVHLSTGCTYEFATVNNYWYGPNALPPISSDITVLGNGGTIRRTASGSPPPDFRFFYVGADPADSDTLDYSTPGAGSLTLRDVTLANGRAKGGDGGRGGGGAGMGGAIFNQGRMTLERVTFDGNLAQGGSSAGCITGNTHGGGGIGSNAPVGTNGGGFGGAVTPINGASSGFSSNFGGGGGGFRAVDDGNGSSGGGPNNGMGGGFGAHQDIGTFLGGNGAGNSAQWADTSNVTSSGGDFGQGGGVSSGGGVGGGGGGQVSNLNSFGAGGGFGGGGGAGSSNGAQNGTTGLFDRGGDGGFGGGGGYGGGGAPTGEPGFGGGGTNGDSFGGGGGGAGMGGAIFNMQGEITIINSTLTDNQATGGRPGFTCTSSAAARPGAGMGGAIFNLNGQLTLANATIAGNGVGHTGTETPTFPDDGADIYNLAYDAVFDRSADTDTGSSILADGTAGSELVSDEPANTTGDAGANDGAGGAGHASDVTLNSFSIVESRLTLGSGTITGTPLTDDPQLGPLAANGGLTPTMLPSPTSPAIDQGTGALTIDQRGGPRPVDIPAIPNAGNGVDIGAVEVRADEVPQPGGGGGGGQSAKTTCRGVEATIVGTNGKDVIAGTPDRDVIQASFGADVIRGRGGRDLICGAEGDDRLKGNGAGDTLIGGADDDLLIGGKGLDTLFGGTPGSPASPRGISDSCPGSESDKVSGCRR